MSTLTKVLVVLLVVSSLVNAGFVTAFVNQTPDWRQNVSDLSEAYAAVDAKDAIDDNTTRATSAALRELNQTLRAKLDGYVQQINDLEAQLSSAEGTINQLQQSAAITEASQATLNQQNTNLVAQVNTLSNRNEALQTDNLQQQRLIQDLEMQVKNLLTDVTALDQQVDTLTRQFDEVSRANELLEQELANEGRASNVTVSQLPGMPNIEVRPDAMRGGPIQGSVTAVSGKAASISVGESDGVTEGMVFTVFRNNGGSARYVGDLMVQRVDQQEAVGVMTMLTDGMSVQTGDTVRDELN